MTNEEYRNSIRTASIRISNSCQLRCKYCYFFYASENELAKITNKTFPIKDVDKIFEMFPNIDTFEFWGAETLIKIDDISEAIKIINKIKPGLEFVVSSNFAYTEKQVTDIFNKLKKLDKELEEPIRFFFQASIDFPKENHDSFRITSDGNSSFDLCYSAYKTFLRLCCSYKFENINISSATKSTYDITKLTVDNVEGIVTEIYKYMDRDVNEFIYNTENSNVNLMLSYMPTFFNITNSNNDTKKAIIKYYDVIFRETFDRIVSGKINKVNIWDYLTGEFTSFLLGYLNREIIDGKNSYRTCYFGEVASIDYNGNIVPCHRAFTGNNFEDYVLGNVYTKEINMEKVNDILEKKHFYKDYYKDFSKALSKHPDFNEDVINSYYRLVSNAVCYADAIHSYNDMTRFNMLNAMKATSPELILYWKEIIDEFSDFFKLLMD